VKGKNAGGKESWYYLPQDRGKAKRGIKKRARTAMEEKKHVQRNEKGGKGGGSSRLLENKVCGQKHTEGEKKGKVRGRGGGKTHSQKE